MQDDLARDVFRLVGQRTSCCGIGQGDVGAFDGEGGGALLEGNVCQGDGLARLDACVEVQVVDVDAGLGVLYGALAENSADAVFADEMGCSLEGGCEVQVPGVEPPFVGGPLFLARLAVVCGQL